MSRNRPEIRTRLGRSFGPEATRVLSGWTALAIVAAIAGPMGCETGADGTRPPYPTAIRSTAETVAEGDQELFAAMLNDEGVPFSFRREAAVRLAESSGRDAAEAFRITWRDGDQRQRDMVMEAIRASGVAGPPVVLVMLDAMLVGKVEVEDVAQIVATDPDRTLAVVRQRIFERLSTSDVERLADLLSRIPEPEAAEIMIDALSDAEDEATVVAIDAALQRWSNTSVSRDADEWRRWWARLRLGDDGSTALKQLTDRIAVESSRADRAQVRAVAAEARAEALAIRLAEVQTKVLAMLEGDARTEALRAMFLDPEPLVRAAGISQVERMLRNAQPVPEVVRGDLAGLIADELPANRISTVKILDAIGVEGLADTLASSLGSETDPTVVAAGLAVLGNRPNPVAIPFAIETIRRGDPRVTPAAARVIAEVAAAGLLHPDDRTTIRGLLPDLEAIDDRDTARTKVLLADEEGLETAQRLLAVEAEAVRRGAAEGFRKRGKRDVLRAAASDPTVSRVAIQAWIDAPPAIDLVNLEVLRELRPLEDTEQARSDFSTWQGAVVQALAALPVDRLADAERILRDEPSLLDARCASLRRGLAAPLIGDEMRMRLQALLIDAMTEGERWTELIAELRSLDAESPASPYRATLFEVLVRTQDWDGAAALEPSVETWVELAEEEGPLDSRTLDPLLREIDRRFDVELDPRLRSRLERTAPTEPAPDA